MNGTYTTDNESGNTEIEGNQICPMKISEITWQYFLENFLVNRWGGKKTSFLNSALCYFRKFAFQNVYVAFLILNFFRQRNSTNYLVSRR